MHPIPQTKRAHLLSRIRVLRASFIARFQLAPNFNKPTHTKLVLAFILRNDITV